MGMKSQTQPVVDIESQKDDRIRKHNHSCFGNYHLRG